MLISLRTLDGNSFELNVEVNDSIYEVKEKIFTQEGLYLEYLKLIFAGKQLEDQRTVRSYGIQKNSTIYIIMRQFSG